MLCNYSTIGYIEPRTHHLGRWSSGISSTLVLDGIAFGLDGEVRDKEGLGRSGSATLNFESSGIVYPAPQSLQTRALRVQGFRV